MLWTTFDIVMLAGAYAAGVITWPMVSAIFAKAKADVVAVETAAKGVVAAVKPAAAPVAPVAPPAPPAA